MSVWLKRLSRWWKKHAPEPIKTPKLMHRRSRYRSVTRTEATFDVSCALVDPPVHPLHVLIIDHVVKAINTPCDLDTGAAVHKLSHDKTCAEPYTQIKQWLAGRDEIFLTDPIIGRLFEVGKKADRTRASRVLKPRPARFRYSPSTWAAFLTKMSSLSVRIAVSPHSQSIYVETPFAPSEYGFVGGMWALAQGPGDPHIGRLLSKYLYQIPGDSLGYSQCWEPKEYFQAEAVWPYGEELPEPKK